MRVLPHRFLSRCPRRLPHFSVFLLQLLLLHVSATPAAMAAAAAAPRFTLRLAPGTRLVLQKADLTKFSGCAIVNAANERWVKWGWELGA